MNPNPHPLTLTLTKVCDNNRFIDIGVLGRGTELDCIYNGQNKKCTKKCREACKQECEATPECDEPGETLTLNANYITLTLTQP